jgi:putative hydrolase of the HAD superfamily
MPVRAIFLDFGGTLVEALPEPFYAFLPVLERFGLSVTRDSWTAADRKVWPQLSPLQYSSLGKTPSFWDVVHSEVLRELGVTEDREQLVRALHDAVTSPEWHRPFPEAESVMNDFRSEGIPLHLVSNNTDYLIEILSRLRWSDYFDSVTYSQEVGAEKPDRRIFEVATRRAKCVPRDGLFVGDSWEADYLGAIRAGLRGIWLNRRLTPRPVPCEWVDSLAAIRRLL